jgi:hypothetical protein
MKPADEMSALPPKADIGTQPRNVRFVPQADSQRRQRQQLKIKPVGKGVLCLPPKLLKIRYVLLVHLCPDHF